MIGRMGFGLGTFEAKSRVGAMYCGVLYVQVVEIQIQIPMPSSEYTE